METSPKNDVGEMLGSLNRTMQYGNFLCRNRKGNQKTSLNRTMQYGNP